MHQISERDEAAALAALAVIGQAGARAVIASRKISK
jgi:hypothetical protein